VVEGQPDLALCQELWKSVHKSLEHTIEQGLKQTARYMLRADLSDNQGDLVISDGRQGCTSGEKLFVRHEAGPNGERIQVWGMSRGPL